MTTRHWIAVVQRDHVRRGVEGGFAQVGHGKGAPLRRMSVGDWVFSYSPRTSLEGGTKLQAFTAVGQVVGADVYQVEMGVDFHPWRRDVHDRVEAAEVPIDDVRDRLAVVAESANWGLTLRRGHLEIGAADARVLAGAMGVTLG
jgi:hypothetical protein